LEIVMRTCIKIVVLGDSSVGKTSLIVSCMSKAFPIEVSKCVPPISINCHSLPVDSLFIDTSGKDNFDKDIVGSDAICIVYDVTNPSSLISIYEFWLPKVKKLNIMAPITIIGNKNDIFVKKNNDIDDLLNLIQAEYENIEYILECSAKNYKEIELVFWLSQKPILFPVSPICIKNNSDKYEFTEKCLIAINNIFEKYQENGVLTTEKFNILNRKCFYVTLSEKGVEKNNE